MNHYLKSVFLAGICSLFCLTSLAQTTIGRRMELEAKVAEKKLMDELEKNSNQPMSPQPGGMGVPPIGLVTLGSKSPVTPQIDVVKAKPVKRPPSTVNIFGINNDLKADVVISDRQYAAVKGAYIGQYLVKDINVTGVTLEETVTTKRKGKSIVTKKTVFAPLMD